MCFFNNSFFGHMSFFCSYSQTDSLVPLVGSSLDISSTRLKLMLELFTYLKQYRSKYAALMRTKPMSEAKFVLSITMLFT